MRFPELIKRFNYGIAWNGALYSVYKCGSMAVTLLLYRQVTADLFCLWAGILSIVYLAALWSDIGLRKSLARYIPLCPTSWYTRFIKSVWCAQIVTVLLALPLFMYGIARISNSNLIIIGIAAGLYIFEVLSHTMKLLYHAHLRNKEYNVVAIICQMGEIIAALCILASTIHPLTTIYSLLLLKLISTTITALWTGIVLYTRLSLSYENITNNNYATFGTFCTQFAQHSGIMWMYTLLKSLSERNALFPALLYIVGPEAASMYKVANDIALTAYRTLVKTIGTTDTALLTRALLKSSSLFHDALRVLYKQLIILTAIVGLGAGIFLYAAYFYTWVSPTIIVLSIIMLIGLLVEIATSAGERLLEVNRRYLILLLCYTPYLLALLAIIVKIIPTSLLLIVGIIHFVRALCAVIMLLISRINMDHH